MAHNYVVTAHKQTAVTACVTGWLDIFYKFYYTLNLHTRLLKAWWRLSWDLRSNNPFLMNVQEILLHPVI